MKYLRKSLACIYIMTGLLLIMYTGCGGDDRSNNGTGPGGSIGFASDNSNPGPNSVALQQHSASSMVLTLDVAMIQVQNVYGAAFEIRFPAGVIRYTGSAPGGFLSGDGAPVSVQVAENPAGVLVVGVTRLGDVGGISGSGDLLRLQFEAIASGSGSLAFQNASLRDPDNNVIPGVNWVGGFVTVVR